MIVEGKLQKVSDEVPKIASRIDGVFFRQPYFETFNGMNGCLITSKEHKKLEMARRGIREYEDAPVEEKYQKPKTFFTKEGKKSHILDSKANVVAEKALSPRAKEKYKLQSLG